MYGEFLNDKIWPFIVALCNTCSFVYCVEIAPQRGENEITVKL